MDLLRGGGGPSTPGLTFAGSSMFGPYSSSNSGINFDLECDFPQAYALAPANAPDSLAMAASSTTIDKVQTRDTQGQQPPPNPSRGNDSEQQHHIGPAVDLMVVPGSSSGKSMASNLSTTTTARETTTTSSTPAEEEPFKCTANGRGWLSALHLAAQRGRIGIVRTCKTKEKKITP